MTQLASDQPSNSTNDWSHIRETINMLYLAVCQIEATLSDSNQSVETLTKSFTGLAEHTNDVSEQIQKLANVEDVENFKNDLSITAQEMHKNIFASVQAFQFYDRVCQRLDHVARSLEKVSNLMENEEKVCLPSEWKQVQETIKSSYTMEAERIMFEFIMRGGSVRDALDIYRHHFTNEQSDSDGDDEIELF